MVKQKEQINQAPVWKEISSGMIALNLISPSKTNPRKRIDPQAQKELLSSVREHGIIENILLRPAFKDRKTKSDIIGSYEIICGERRFQAAKEAGLKFIPARVVEMEDKGVLEIQIIENMQRSDLHPLEEAEGYELLMKEYGCAGAEQIAQKVGKSKSYVYARMKLCDLVPGCRRLFYDGKLTPSTALLIARIPKELQEQAGKEITNSQRYGEKIMSYRNAIEHLQSHYMLELKDAAFPKDDETLAAKAGPCSRCPKRTGNQTELFPDIKCADVCTDPQCFEQKQNAFFQRQLAKAKKSSENVLPVDTCKKLFPSAHDTNITYGSEYVDLSETCYSAKTPAPYKKILEKSKTFQPCLAIDQQGTIHQVAKKADVNKALKEMGIKASESNDSYKFRKEEADKRKLIVFKNIVTRQVIIKLIEAFKNDSQQSYWPLVAKQMMEDSNIDVRHLVALRLNNKVKIGEAADAVDKHFKSMDAKDCSAFAFELLISRKVFSYGDYADIIIEFCKHYGIDIKKIAEDIKAEGKKGNDRKS